MRDRGDSLRKLSEYVQHAQECRDMARTATPEHKAMLEQMAETWDQLAEARKRQLDKRGVPYDQDDGSEAASAE
jgi:hypothetical protein